MFAFASLLYNITSEVEKCFDTKEVIILQTRKQKYCFDSTIGKYKVDFHLPRESKMCQYVIGSAHTPHYLIVCRRSVIIYFLCKYVRNKIHTCLYTISAINFKE
jgi:hypothetical protein